jgi:hypothetical protein
LHQQRQKSGKRGLDVADHGEFGRIGTPEVADIGRHLKDVAAGWHGRAFCIEDGDDRLAAECEHRVIGPQYSGDLARLRRQIAGPERMRGREGDVQRPGRSIDRRAEGLSQTDGLGSGVAGRDLVAGNDGQLSGRNGGEIVGQTVEGACDRGPVDRGGFGDAGGRHFLHDVHRQCEKHRSGRRRIAVVEGPANQDRDLVCVLNLLRPFDRRPRDSDEIPEQERVGDGVPRILLASGHDQRRSRYASIKQIAGTHDRAPRQCED